MCSVPILYVASILEAEMSAESQPQHKFNADKIRRLMIQRADILKGDLYDTLYVDPSEARQDELGNEYYVVANVYNKRRS
jgi:hypothetical protein